MNTGPRVALTDSYWPADVADPLIDETVGAILARRADEHPDRCALIAVSHDGTAVRLTYRQLHVQALQAAHALLAVVPPGTHVALWAPSIAEWPIIEYAAMLAGLVLVAVNPALREPELAYVLNHSEAPLLIHAEDNRGRDMTSVAASIRSDCRHLRRAIGLTEWSALAESEDHRRLLPPVDPSKPAMLQYTSGTTGHPKAVLLSQRAMLNNARFTMRAAQVQDGAVCVSPMPTFHTAGCITCTLGPLWVGGTQVLARRFHPVELIELIEAVHATVLFETPAILRAMLDVAASQQRPLPRIATLMGGAAMIPPELVDEAEAAFGASMHNLYGQTELASVATIVRRDQTAQDKTYSVGRPLPHLEVKVVDITTRSVVPVGQSGEILARGYQTLLGYFNDPRASAFTKSVDGWVRTGDLGTMDSTGTITLTGRLKEIIIRGGENISPLEIETLLRGHEAVLEAAVIGIPDRRFGEVVAAALQIADGYEMEVIDELRALLEARLAAFKVPQQWYLIDDFPVTVTGKLQRFKLQTDIVEQRLRRLD